MDTESSSPHSSPDGSPPPRTTVLPSLRSIAPVRSLSESDELARRVGQIELDRRREITTEERRKHTELIRDLLVSINGDYKSRFGTPPPVSSVEVKEEEEDMRMNLVSPPLITA